MSVSLSQGNISQLYQSKQQERLKNCQICSKELHKIGRRQHQCKRCFRTVCSGCANQKAFQYTFEGKNAKKHRQCKLCIDEVNQLKKYISQQKIQILNDSELAQSWLRKLGIDNDQQNKNEYQLFLFKNDSGQKDSYLQFIESSKIRILETRKTMNYTFNELLHMSNTYFEIDHIQNSLENVVSAFLRKNNHVGISNGIILLAFILVILCSEATAYKILDSLFDKIIPDQLFPKNLQEQKMDITDLYIKTLERAEKTLNLDQEDKNNLFNFMSSVGLKHLEGIGLNTFNVQTSLHLLNQIILEQDFQIIPDSIISSLHSVLDILDLESQVDIGLKIIRDHNWTTIYRKVKQIQQDNQPKLQIKQQKQPQVYQKQKSASSKSSSDHEVSQISVSSYKQSEFTEFSRRESMAQSFQQQQSEIIQQSVQTSGVSIEESQSRKISSNEKQIPYQVQQQQQQIQMQKKKQCEKCTESSKQNASLIQIIEKLEKENQELKQSLSNLKNDQQQQQLQMQQQQNKQDKKSTQDVSQQTEALETQLLQKPEEKDEFQAENQYLTLKNKHELLELQHTQLQNKSNEQALQIQGLHNALQALQIAKEEDLKFMYRSNNSVGDMLDSSQQGSNHNSMTESTYSGSENPNNFNVFSQQLNQGIQEKDKQIIENIKRDLSNKINLLIEIETNTSKKEVLEEINSLLEQASVQYKKQVSQIKSILNSSQLSDVNRDHSINRLTNSQENYAKSKTPSKKEKQTQQNQGCNACQTF